MSVKLKAILISVISFFVFAILSSLITYPIISKYIVKIEDKSIDNAFEVLNSILGREEQNIKRTSLDWAHWDETYNFITDKNQEYIDDNFMDNTMEQLDMNSMFFIDSSNKMVYEKNYQTNNKEIEAIKDTIFDDSNTKGISTSSIDAKTGVIYANDKLFIVAIAPITTSDEKSKVNGKLIMVRKVDEELISYIDSMSKTNVQFGVKNGTKSLLNVSLINRNDKYITASRYIKDINGENNIIAIEKIERYSYNVGLNYIKSFILLYLVVLLVVLIINAIVLNKYILKRLGLIDGFISEVGKTKNTGSRLLLDGNDEFNKIANSTNNMLAEIAMAYDDIKERDERFRLIMGATKDGYFDIDLNNNKLYINQEWIDELGYEAKDEYGLFHEYFTKVHPDSINNLRNEFFQLINKNNEFFDLTYMLLKNTSDIIWVLHRGKVISRDEEGKPIRILSVLIDITDRKRYEEDILFLSYSDKLTGLRNRAYMEKQFEELDKNSSSSYFIIMGDINGLRVINDGLGHKEGDRLLCSISSEIKGICSEDDIVSRWGGDEFIILIKNREKNYVENLIIRIKEACENIKTFPIDVSIALGYAEKDADNVEAELVMNVAEKRMYRNKLIEKKSTRSAIISSLLRTLHEKHSETEEHTRRIRDMGTKLGKKLGLSQDKLDELELLGLLHDIGKIGIPEQILLKPGKLTSEEWTVMKTHTEIGYRIAKSTPELSHIAEEILSHHERYDGTGYPNGWKGKEIPLLARIINVVDSFDVMTHKRVYNEEKDIHYAIEEIKRCSSTQFDPEIAKVFLEILEEEKRNNNR